MKHAGKFRLSSLRTRLTLIVVLCWITPMILIGGYSIFYFYGDVNQRIDNSIRYDAEYASNITTQNLEYTINLSRQASYDDDIWNAYVNYTGGGDYYAFYRSVTTYLQNKYYLEPDLTYACLFLVNNPDTSYYVSDNGVSDYNYYKTNVQQQVIRRAKTLETSADFIISGKNIYLIRNIMSRNTVKPYAVLVLQLNPTSVFRYFTQNSLWNGSMFFMLNSTYGSAGGTAFAKTDKLLEGLSTNSYLVTEDRRNIIFYGKSAPGNDDFTFGYKVAIGKHTMYKSYYTLLIVVVILMVTLIPLLLTVLLFFRRNVAKPISSLVSASKALKAGRLGIQAAGAKNDEFGYLIDTFNSMSDEINTLVNTVLKEQLVSKDSRIMALESQINPHFLNNTLEMMNWRSRMQGDEQLSKMIEALSTILEAGMDRFQQRVIPLSEELKHVEAYLYLMSMRFGNRLTIHKEIDENLLSVKIPRLVIQTLIENAVVHGFEPVNTGTIWLNIYRENGNVVIQVKNSGKPLSTGDMEKINRQLNSAEPRSDRLGIANVSERLRLIYGENANLSIVMDGDGITNATVVIKEDLQNT